MTTRLVLGAGGLGRTIVDDLAERPGDLAIVTDDEHRVDTLRADGFRVVASGPTDASVLASLDLVPDTVVVADDDPDVNRVAARAASEVFPDAILVAYTGRDAEPDAARTLDAVADRVVDSGRAVVESVLERVGSQGVHARQLQAAFRRIDGHVAVVTHDNPDPDAIASAVAVAHVAERAGCTATVCYYGAITHQENRAFVNVLEYDLVNLERGEVPEDADGVALVDHSRPGVNDGLPADTRIDVVVDHHPPRAPVDAGFVDLRSDIGATSTLMVQYLETLGVDLEAPLATGLLFGIHVDTNDFRRGVSPADFEAAATLVPHADVESLRRIESPSISAETLAVIGRAIENRRQEGSILVSGVGEISDRDALSQAADRLLDLEDVGATLVFGISGETIHVSARERGTDIDLGETLRDAFGRIGSAGGHADMAGAQITLGVLESVEDREESLVEIVDAVVTERFLEALDAGDYHRPGGLYDPIEVTADAYLDPDAEALDATGPEGADAGSPEDDGEDPETTDTETTDRG